MLEPDGDCPCCKAMWHAQEQNRPVSGEEIEESFREAKEKGIGYFEGDF